MNKLISFKKTAVGWYNFNFAIFKYNVNPETFRSITGVSELASLGSCEVSSEELTGLIGQAKCIGMADGWELLRNDEETETAPHIS